MSTDRARRTHIGIPVECGAVKRCVDLRRGWSGLVGPEYERVEADVDDLVDVAGGNLVGQGLRMNAPIR
jgi:hypothetical protein